MWTLKLQVFAIHLQWNGWKYAMSFKLLPKHEIMLNSLFSQPITFPIFKILPLIAFISIPFCFPVKNLRNFKFLKWVWFIWWKKKRGNFWCKIICAKAISSNKNLEHCCNQLKNNLEVYTIQFLGKVIL